MPDGRELPEWVEFEWSEPPYPEDPKQTLEEYRALPRKTARVPVRSRVPQDVVEEVLEAKRRRKPHQLPEKMLDVYFIWTEAGVKFRWGVGTRGGMTLREGGDAIDAP